MKPLHRVKLTASPSAEDRKRIRSELAAVRRAQKQGRVAVALAAPPSLACQLSPEGLYAPRWKYAGVPSAEEFKALIEREIREAREAERKRQRERYAARRREELTAAAVAYRSSPSPNKARLLLKLTLQAIERGDDDALAQRNAEAVRLAISIGREWLRQSAKHEVRAPLRAQPAAPLPLGERRA